MPTVNGDPDFLKHLRERDAETDGVFWHGAHRLIVFDADAAARANSDNFADLTLPDRFVDLVRRRRSPVVSWRQVRAVWLAQLRVLCGEEGLAALAARMDRVLGGRLDQHVDLVWVAHEVMFRSLVPMVVDGLSTSDLAWLSRDAIAKLVRLTAGPEGPSRRQRLRAMAAQLHTGRVVRREIRARAAGRRPPRTDLTEPVVAELLGELGVDRALDAVTAVLTAITGPPGAAASCVMFELTNQPEWARALTEEFAKTDLAELCRTGTRCASVAHRFVKEVLRMWSPPLLMTRSVRAPITVAATELMVGEHYLVSPYMVNHDGRHWTRPDVFDPDRWLPGSTTGPAGGRHYVPFGWAPTSCIGAQLGTSQLVLLAYLLCTRYRIELRSPDRARVALAAVPMPMDFDGRLIRRPDSPPPATC